MIVFNTKNNLYIEITEGSAYVNGTYGIYPLRDSLNCPESLPTYSGAIPADLKLNLELPDGQYEIKLVAPAEGAVDLTERFIVIYNSLPLVLKSLKKIICSEYLACDSCEGLGEEKAEAFLEEQGFMINLLSCMGLWNLLPYTTGKQCLFHKELLEEKTKSRYYGDYKYDYKRKTILFFAYLYAELYQILVRSLKETDEDRTNLEADFQVGIFKNCFYKLELDLEGILLEIKNFNCNCN